LEASTGLVFDASTFIVSQLGAGDSSGLAIGSVVILEPTPITDFDYGAGSGSGLHAPLGTVITKTWTDALGTFTETLDTVVAIARNPSIPNSIGVTLTGTLNGPGFVDSPVNLILTANQAGGPGQAISASLTNISSATSTPEPSTWVMLALGFAGLGYAAVRRSAKDRSAIAI
jgi:hypothetical protein